MSMHIADDLPRLLTGDATRDVVLEAAEHLRTCADCQQELVSAVVAHAALTSAHRFAPEMVAPSSHDNLVAESETDEPDVPLPDMSAMFSKVRAEAAAPTVVRPLYRRRAGLVAAAAAVVVGGGAVVAVSTLGSDGPQTRSVALQPFGQGSTKATAVLVGSNRIKLDASALPKLDRLHRYEIWLTDEKRTQMQSIGFIQNNNTADLPVPASIMSQYKDIEVSVQKLDQIKYSGTSVLRGNYG